MAAPSDGAAVYQYVPEQNCRVAVVGSDPPCVGPMGWWRAGATRVDGVMCEPSKSLGSPARWPT